MRAAIYARVSTERQERQQTIDSQIDRLRAWARSTEYDLSKGHVFRDEGYSGARLDRPGLDALRDAVRDREVDIIGVYIIADRHTEEIRLGSAWPLSDKPRLQPLHRDPIVLCRREQMPVSVEGHLDGRMPHERLNTLRAEPLLDE